MINKSLKKALILTAGAVFCLCVGVDALAAVQAAFSGQGIGSVASTVRGNLSSIATLITAGSYVAGMGFGVGAIVKFKAHKDNPTQVAIGVPIAMLFIAAALLFVPSVFKTTGATLFGASGKQAGISGISSF